MNLLKKEDFDHINIIIYIYISIITKYKDYHVNQENGGIFWRNFRIGSLYYDLL